MAVAATGTSAAPVRRGLHYAVTRLATVGDQVLVALTNFGLTILIGRAFGAEELGAYGIGLSIGLMTQGLQRHAITIPLMLRPARWVERKRGGVVAEQALVLGIALFVSAAALFAVWAAGASRFTEMIVMASATCLIVYLELEFARAFLVKIGKPVFVLAGAVFFAVSAGALGVAALAHWIGFETLLAGLGVALLVHAAGVIALARSFSISEGVRLLGADLRRYGGWAGIATATYAGYNHVPLMILGAVAAPVHAAVFVATRSLMQPLQILLRGLDVADKTLFAEKRPEADAAGASRFTLKLVALYASIGALFGALAGLGAEQLLSLAYGTKFAGHGAALVAWIPAYVLLSASLPLESLVYARKSFGSYFAVRGVASVIAIAISVPLIARYAEVGAIAACAAGWFVAVTGTAAILLRRGGR